MDLDAGEEGPTRRTASQSCKPRHPKFYFGSGDVVFICEELSFRIHSELLSNNSSVFLETLKQARSNGEHLSDGCPCVHLSDAAEDFATLLKVFYTPGCVCRTMRLFLRHSNRSVSHCRFLHRHKTPDFTTFSSLLRLTTKYKFQEIRTQILLDLLPAYPTQLSEYKASPSLGEAVFGSPLPHPNTVLNLFVTCEVPFTLPFAYYRASIAGDPASLNTSAGGFVLPPNTLKVALRGQAQLKTEQVQLAKKLALQDCPGWLGCSGKIPSNRVEVFDWIHPKVATKKGILERGDFVGPKYCSQCLQTFAKELSKAQADTWEKLPSYFSLPPWEKTTGQPF